MQLTHYMSQVTKLQMQLTHYMSQVTKLRMQMTYMSQVTKLPMQLTHYMSQVTTDVLLLCHNVLIHCYYSKYYIKDGLFLWG